MLRNGAGGAARVTSAVALSNSVVLKTGLIGALPFSSEANVKVLLVEADAALRGSLATLLVNAGISVVEAGNATEALSLAHAIGHHDMLIIDHVWVQTSPVLIWLGVFASVGLLHH